MGELGLALLGSPRIFVDGEENILRERKAVALLAWLAVEGRPQRRDTLATLFWPEHDQQRARANLRYLLWALRKQVGEEWLETDGDQLALSGAGVVWLDVVEFRRHLDAWRAHSHPAGEVCPACVESLETAVQLYRGDFLQGFSLDDSPAFDDWQFFQAEELRREMTAGLEALVEQETARQDYEAAIEYARRWLALEPLHEPAHRALMRLYAWAGQYEAAVRQFHRCALALQEEIGVEPDAETTELYAQIRNRRFPLPAPTEANTHLHQTPPSDTPSPPAGNLPTGSTLFVGRQTELAQIAERLSDPATRLLTIVGPGGMGKSSLAMHAGRAAAGAFTDGVWFVSLAGLESPEQMPAAILNGLDPPSEGGASPRQQLFRYLRDRQCLLILDNFEDVLTGADFLTELLHACPGVRMLVTSRERLNLREEWLLSLGSLGYPANGAALDGSERYSALQLFTLSAQRIQPGFVLDQTSLSPVVRICQLVEGMPLALEMAAAWVRTLPVAAIPGEIEKSLGFLSSGSRNAPERHRSIHAVFDHSWQLLAERERSLLRQLSVFRNSFSREGAEAVADASLLDLSALLDKSWIRLDSDGRYVMHALAQQYALEKLRSGTGETAGNVLRRHCLFYANLTSPDGPSSATDSSISIADIENIHLAWDTALAQRNWMALGQIGKSIFYTVNRLGSLGIMPRIERTITQLESGLLSIPTQNEEDRAAVATAATNFLHVASEYQRRSGFREQSIAYLIRGRSILDRYRDTSIRAKNAYIQITRALAVIFYHNGQFVRAQPLLQEALAGFDSLGDKQGSAYACQCLALVYDRLGRYQDAEDVLLSITSVEETEEPGRLRQLLPLGRIYSRQGRYAEAQPILEEAYELSPRLYKSHVLIYLGAVMRGLGYLSKSEKLLRRGLVLSEEMGDRPAQADLLLQLGFTGLQLGVTEAAQNDFARSLAISEEIGRRHTASRALLGLGQVELQTGEMAKARKYLSQALTIAEEVNAPPDLLDVLVGVAALHMAEGKPDAAIELLELAQAHPATTHETRTHAQSMLRSLGQEVVASAGRMTDEEAQSRLGKAVQAMQILSWR